MDTDFWTTTLMRGDVDKALEDLHKSGALKTTFPEVTAMVGFGGGDQGHKDLWDHTKKVVKQAKAIPEVRWAALFHDVGKVQAFSTEAGKITFHQHEFVSAKLFRQAMKRTGLLKGDFRNRVNDLIRNLSLVEGYSSEWTDSAIRRLNRDLGETLKHTLLLARADVTSKHAHKREKVHRLVHELEQRCLEVAQADAVVPPLPKGLGQAILATFSIPPSKKIGEIREALEALVEAGSLEGHKDSGYYIDYLVNSPGDFGLPGV